MEHVVSDALGTFAGVIYVVNQPQDGCPPFASRATGKTCRMLGLEPANHPVLAAFLLVSSWFSGCDRFCSMHKTPPKKISKSDGKKSYFLNAVMSFTLFHANKLPAIILVHQHNALRWLSLFFLRAYLQNPPKRDESSPPPARFSLENTAKDNQASFYRHPTSENLPKMDTRCAFLASSFTLTSTGAGAF